MFSQVGKSQGLSNYNEKNEICFIWLDVYHRLFLILHCDGTIFIDSCQIYDKYIYVALCDHIMQWYNHNGEIINYANKLTYESDELRYTTSKNYNEEGTLASETEDVEPQPVEKMAKCRRYEAESGWYGLMSTDGKVLTPPSYSDIKAIGYDIYLCKDNDEDGVILNGKGERIR